MKRTITFFTLLLMLTSCNDNSNNKLPSDFTEAAFSQSFDVPIGTNEVTLTRSANQLSGTATFNYIDYDGTGGGNKSCVLTISFSQEESNTLINMFAAATYCTEAITEGTLGAGSNTITFIANSGDLTVSKKNTGCCEPEIKYLCSGGDAIYSYLKAIIQTNTDISNCPSNWENMFDN